MESHTSVRRRLDELADTDDDASTLSWPPRDDGSRPGVVDLPLPETATSRARFASPAAGAADRTPVDAAATPHRTSRRIRFAIGVLAALALAEAIVIGLLVGGNEPITQMTARPRERLGLRNADGAASTAAGATTPASAPVDGMSGQSPAAAADAPSRTVAQLQVQTNRAGATVIVDGRRRGAAPLTVEGLAPGAHLVRLVSGDRSVEQTVVVQPGVATALVMPMGRGAPAPGWVDLVMPFEVQIFEQGRLVGTSAQARLQFAAGEHRFELANNALGYRAVQIVRVKPGEVAEVRPEVPTGLVSINATPWAEVWIDGRQAGTTPLGNVRVPLGMREVRFRHPELGEETRRVLVTAAEPARVSLDFRP